MKAALFTGLKRIEIRDIPIPTPKSNEVLIKNKVCGVCGTDVHIYHGEPGSAEVSPPVVLGHEFSGEITALGSAVTGLKVGDHVTVDPNIYCGVCEACRRGKKQLCENMRAVGVTQNGGFEEYSLVQASQVFLLDPKISLEAGAMAEPLACCIHGIDLLKITPGDTVCVIGGGAIGLILLQLVRLSGASHIALSEPNTKRRDIALELGADYVLDPTDPAQIEAYLEDCGGADKIIECAGSVSAAKSAVQFAGSGASILLFSVPSPEAKLEFPLFDIYKKELTIMGSFVNPDTHSRAVRLINRGLIRFEPIITHRFGIADTENAIKTQMGSDSVKVLVCEDALLT